MVEKRDRTLLDISLACKDASRLSKTRYDLHLENISSC